MGASTMYKVSDDVYGRRELQGQGLDLQGYTISGGPSRRVWVCVLMAWEVGECVGQCKVSGA